MRFYILFFVLELINASTWRRHDERVINAESKEADEKQLNYDPREASMNATVNAVNKVHENIEKVWPMGIVRYFYNTNFYDDLLSRSVRELMNYIESVSCITFQPLLVRPDPGNYSFLEFSNPDNERECVHNPKYNEDGSILIVLGLDCLEKPQLLHTIMHGVGFEDEVTHPHRDQYVRIQWDNIHPKYRQLFRINLENLGAGPLAEYDPLSVMHFHDRAFSRNGKETISPLSSGLLIQPSTTLSQLDQMRIRLMFSHECNKRDVGTLIETCKNVVHQEIYDTTPKDDEDKSLSDSTESNNTHLISTSITDSHENDVINITMKMKNVENPSTETIKPTTIIEVYNNATTRGRRRNGHRRSKPIFKYIPNHENFFNEY